MRTREIHLVRRPDGVPHEGDFELATVELPQPQAGEVLVRNVWMSVDPYMRGRMSDRKSYVAPYQVGQVLDGGSVGRVTASRNPAFAEGDWVLANRGWREGFLSDGEGLRRIPPAPPPRWHLGALGMPGLTAYVGLLRIGRIAPGETVFVTGAAGAVGSLACQIARLKGCRVVGSAGSAAKVAWLEEQARVDAAFDYKTTEDVAAELGRLCPDGIDVVFDNVGGRFLDAALVSMREFGRIVLCGAISVYNATRPPRGPAAIALAIPRRLTLQGFIVFDHVDMRDVFEAEMTRWLSEGSIAWHETVVDGLEKAPQAFLGLFSGDNLGKMLVRLGPDDA
ncbi:MAG: NADP-dependent oxidoreductase [Acidobacteriota bacterium]